MLGSGFVDDNPSRSDPPAIFAILIECRPTWAEQAAALCRDGCENNSDIAASADLLIENKPPVLLILAWSSVQSVGLWLPTALELNSNVIPIDLALEFHATLLTWPDVDLEIVDFSGHPVLLPINQSTIQKVI